MRKRTRRKRDEPAAVFRAPVCVITFAIDGEAIANLLSGGTSPHLPEFFWDVIKNNAKKGDAKAGLVADFVRARVWTTGQAQSRVSA